MGGEGAKVGCVPVDVSFIVERFATVIVLAVRGC